MGNPGFIPSTALTGLNTPSPDVFFLSLSLRAGDRSEVGVNIGFLGP